MSGGQTDIFSESFMFPVDKGGYLHGLAFGGELCTRSGRQMNEEYQKIYVSCNSDVT
jgi:hypothetical protein